MSMLDVFNSNIFGMVSLSEAIDTVPYMPSRLGELGLFSNRPLTTTTAVVEYRHHTLRVIPNKARGTHDNAASRPPRNAYEFQCAHLPEDAALKADDIQGVRAFGSENNMEVVSQAVSEVLTDLRQDHETTFEWHRMGAISGQLLDADGSVLHDYFARFGVTQTVINMLLDTATTEVKTLCTQIIRTVNTAMGGTPWRRIHVMCGDSFWDKFITHPKVVTAYERYRDGEVLRTNQVYEVFPFGNIDWENYRGDIGGNPWIPTDEAKVIVKGAPKLYLQHNAPADFVETVNTRGRPMYVKQKRQDYDKGIDFHSQSNPLFMVTRPAVCIKLNENN